MNHTAQALADKWIAEELALDEIKNKLLMEHEQSTTEGATQFRFIIAEAWRLKRCRTELQVAFGLVSLPPDPKSP